MTESKTYISGGYFLTQVLGRPEYMNAEIVPEKVVTISTCLTNVMPSGWYVNEGPDDGRLDEARSMGVPKVLLKEIHPWLREHPAEGGIWPYAFTTVDIARLFGRQFLASAKDVRLVGASLPSELVTRFLDEAAPNYVSVFTEVIRLNRPPESDGEFLGFEVLGDAISEQHTILCTGDHEEVLSELGIRLNKHGLIEEEADALRAAALMSEEGHGEPVLYFPWRVDEYSREAEVKE